MNVSVLACPQCAAPLPRHARWRTVSCPYCQSTVTHNEPVARAAHFRQARARVWAAHVADDAAGRPTLRCGDQHYGLLAKIGQGEHADVYLAKTRHPLPQRVTVKIARPDSAPGRLAAEAAILDRLQALGGAGAAYFSQRLPQAVAHGTTEDGAGGTREVLVLRHPSGFWGSLADTIGDATPGVDPRHAVWMWRRILEVLAYLHDRGWTHGDLLPAHLLLHPRDHGVLPIGWSRARPSATAERVARDLMQAAWAIRAVLHGGTTRPAIAPEIPHHTPPPLAELLRRASEDAAWCVDHGARRIEQALRAATRQVYGPPRFIPYHPTAAHC
ncbi:MAG TPA: lipopolysaccharide kinase InaA family protein [Accumulibacter sp.]|jgi:hypothetical protein|nr:lipopolysaccharide kinase InaA family protein [Accumulibacter sp.]